MKVILVKPLGIQRAHLPICCFPVISLFLLMIRIMHHLIIDLEQLNPNPKKVNKIKILQNFFKMSLVQNYIILNEFIYVISIQSLILILDFENDKH